MRPQRSSHIAPQEGHDLGAGAGLSRREGRGAGQRGDGQQAQRQGDGQKPCKNSLSHFLIPPYRCWGVFFQFSIH